jgi:uncharacterized membrane protein YgdD (TMEM256/DUF423 family)
MGFVNAAFLIILGAFCVPALVAQKSPDAKKMLDKIIPYQGIIGFISFIWGIWIVIQCILRLDWFGYNFPVGIILWATWILNALLSIAAGAILGWSLIQKHLLAKASMETKLKAEESLSKLVSMQPKIGIACIVFGLWVLVSTIIF